MVTSYVPEAGDIVVLDFDPQVGREQATKEHQFRRQPHRRSDGQHARTSIGPIDVGPGVEKTVCIVKGLGNADPLFVSNITGDLAVGSHHLIVYRTTDQENLTPTPCPHFRVSALDRTCPSWSSMRRT